MMNAARRAECDSVFCQLIADHTAQYATAVAPYGLRQAKRFSGKQPQSVNGPAPHFR
jgi:hypothetical protein